MSKLFVPQEIDINNISCVYVNNDDSIYLSLNNGNNYELTYNNLLSDYYLKPLGSLDVACNNNIELTHDIFYRKDISFSLIVFIILAIIWLLVPYKIFTRCLGRWLKV